MEALSAKIQHLYRQVQSLLVYRDLLQHEPSQAGLNLLQILSKRDATGEILAQEAEILNAYGEWFYAIAHTGNNWQGWIEQTLAIADNPFTQQAQQQDEVELSQGILKAAQHDLAVLQSWALEGPILVRQAIAAIVTDAVPSVEDLSRKPPQTNLNGSEWGNWRDALPMLMAHYRQGGVGSLAQYRGLRWRDGHLEGIEHPDAIQLADLVGYNAQKTALQHNTETLLAGYAALNVLLYGSRGSGKSALIKALLTAYGDRGLRLIELNKADMIHLPQVVEHLRPSPLKFIIFIDDLSFEEDEDHYKALKVVLEGNLTARPQNVAVYATSNRRHLIREFFGDRPRPSQADEVQAWDTVQEKLSLSDRFGLTLTFEPANQDTYLDIVRHLARQVQVNLPDAELTHQALQWAVRQNVRSGRTARQFIDYVKGMQILKG
ncbi:MAG: ATP-binding protein [Thermosynechococcaceae cyanobacterium]